MRKTKKAGNIAQLCQPKSAIQWISMVWVLMNAGQALAVPLEIIHTNDLHSYFEHGDDPDHGGYAAIKATIDRLKADAAQRGVETITVDAGDFSEGTPLFNADDGSDAWRMIQAIGYDAISIGNHDWLCGPKQMDEIVSKVRPETPFLGANLKVNRFENLKRYLFPHIEMVRGGMKIAIVGLATRERVYRWRFEGGKIKSPIRTMRRELRTLRDRNDLVIALTHLGLDEDRRLADRVDGVDLIVGGHSHTLLPDPILIPKDDGRSVPIVQTGAHGQFVGDLVIDYQPGQPVRILSYRLIPVLNVNGDPEIQKNIQAIETQFEEKYGKDWLNTVLASQSTPMLTPAEHPTAWGNFFVDAIRKAVGADIALDSSEFFGQNQLSGPITRRSLLNFYPRFFDLKNKMGWTVWTIELNGLVLQEVIKIAVKNKTFLNFSNLTYDVKDTPTGPRARRVSVDGHPIRLAKTYRIAVTEGFGLGAEKIHWLLRMILKPVDSGVSVWTAVENHLKSVGAPQNELAGGPHMNDGIEWHSATADEVQSSFKLLLRKND